MKSVNKKQLLILSLVLLLFLSLRLPGLGGDLANSDAARWHRRSIRFLDALSSGDLASTYQHYQPGVTLMWLTSVPRYLDSKIQLLSVEAPLTLEHSGYFPIIHSYSKAVLVLTLSMLLLVHFYFLVLLFDFKVAVWYGSLMAVEPYLIGIDRYFHLTSLESYSGFAALLVLLYWLKNSKYVFVVLSAGLFSFSVLSKLTTVGLLPFFGFIFLMNYKNNGDKRTLVNSVLTFSGVLVGLFTLAFPAMWVIPLEVLSKLYAAIFNAVSTDPLGNEITGWLALLFYDLILALRLSPITYALLTVVIFSLPKLLTNKYLKYVILFLVYYWFLLTIPDKKIDRYVVVMLPALLLLIAYYVTGVSLKVQKLLGIFISLYTLLVVATYHPVYSAHYSTLLGGVPMALRLGVYDNSGEYYAQAAQYLNTKGRDIVVFVPFNIESFSYFYSGNVVREFNLSVDYVVTSIEHQSSVPLLCDLEQSFGGVYKVVGVYRCN